MQSRGAAILLMCVLFFATARLSAWENIGRSDKRPNVIFFLADDLGWLDSTLYGSLYHETPNVDQLATRGMRFTNAYAAKVADPHSPAGLEEIRGLFRGGRHDGACLLL